MPDLTPGSAAPIAAPAAAPAPQPEVAPTPPKFESGSLAKDLHRLLTATEPDPTEPVKKPEEPKPKVEAPVPKAAVEERPIKVRKAKVEPEVRPELPTKAVPAAAAPAAAAPAPAAKPAETDADFEAGLVDEEKALLDDARTAEKLLGTKYAGHEAKMKSFLKEAAKKTAEEDFDEADYRKWYEQNRPKIAALDYRQMERERMKAEVAKDFEPKIEAERHARWAETEAPKVKAKGDDIYKKLVNSALPDEVQAAIKERTKGLTDRAEIVKTIQAVEKDYALETEITHAVVNAATNDLEEFHRLTTANPTTGKPLRDFDPNNQQHNRILSIVKDVCDTFKTTGGAELKKDGKWFATREEYTDMADAVKNGRLPREELAKWWTFTNDEIADRAQANVKGAIAQAVAAKKEEFEKRYGFQRPARAAAPVPTAAPAPVSGAPAAPRIAPPPAAPGAAAPSAGALLASKLAQG